MNSGSTLCISDEHWPSPVLVLKTFSVETSVDMKKKESARKNLTPWYPRPWLGGERLLGLAQAAHPLCFGDTAYLLPQLRTCLFL